MKIDLAALIQLAAHGNSKAVEDAWMAALDGHTGDPGELASWSPVLKTLAEHNRAGEAETLAWATIEAVQEHAGMRDALKVAGPFLLVLSHSDELRSQVAELYATAYADRENLEALLEEAGIVSGRPPRRAVRTLEVCLDIVPGSYLAGRHEHEAARVESIDSESWEVTIETPTGRQTLGPVELADNYQVTSDDDFRVLRQFAPDEWRTLLERKPAQIVISILRAHDNHVDGDTLAKLLTPDSIPQSGWTKWWTKARTALKRDPNVQIEGRAPYEIRYHAVAVTLESETEAKFDITYDPAEQFACVESYARECRARSCPVDPEMLARFKKRIDQAAARRMRARARGALATLMASRGVAVAMGTAEDQADQPVVEFLAAAADPVEHLREVTFEAFWPVACRSLKAAHPQRYVEFCAALLPEAPTGVCDMLAGELRAGGYDQARFETLVQQILRDAVRCVNSLAWLWLGPGAELDVPIPPLPTLCSKLLAVAGEMRRRDDCSRETKKRTQTRIRDSLSASRYAKFKACLEQIDAGIAAAWRTQIVRLDNLGRAVPEDLRKLTDAAFPQEQRVPDTIPWKRTDVLYMTAAGRSRLIAEIDELVNVKIAANAKAIGAAAAHGDLSENSEYKFALEERDLLHARLALLQAQLAQAVVLRPTEAPGDHIGFGTRVVLRNTEDGRILQMTFLGPWESDVERAVYNYKSPVGQALMGLAPGDPVELSLGEHPGPYTVEKIENVLQE